MLTTSRAATLSYPSTGNAQMKFIEPTENTAPPFGVSKKVRSERMMSYRFAGQVWSRRSSFTGW